MAMAEPSLARPRAEQWAFAEGVSPIAMTGSLNASILCIPSKGTGLLRFIVRRFLSTKPASRADNCRTLWWVWRRLLKGCALICKCCLNPTGLRTAMRESASEGTPTMISALSGAWMFCSKNAPIVRFCGSIRLKISLTIQPRVSAWYSRRSPSFSER